MLYFKLLLKNYIKIVDRSIEVNKIDKNKIIAFFKIIRKWRNYLVFSFLIIAVASFITVLYIPKWYKSEVRFMAKSTSGSNIFLKNLSSSLINDDMFSISLSESDFEDIILSRKILDAYNQKFNIQKRYKIKYIEDYYQKFCKKNIVIDKNVESGLGVSDIITYKLEVYDKDPIIAKDGANFIISEFQKILEEFYQQENEKRISVLTELKDKYSKEFNSVKDSLSNTVKKTGMLPLDFLANSENSENNNLRNEIIKLKIEKELKLKEYSPDSPIINQINEKLKVLEDKYKLLSGTNIKNFNETTDEFLKVNSIYYNFELLKTMLLQIDAKLKLEENKKLSFISPVRIIDYGNIPQKKSKPKRLIILILILITTAAVNITGITIYEYFSSLPDDIKRELKSLIFIE